MDRYPTATKGVLFDFGGTLLSYNREEIFRSLLEEKGIAVTREAVARAYEAVEPEWYRSFPGLGSQPVTDETLVRLDLMVLESLGINADNQDLARFITKNWQRMEEQLPQPLVRQAYPDSLPCLEMVSEMGLKMGVVSNIESEQRLRKELALIGLSEFFPVLVASGSVGYVKPAKQIFDIAASLVRLSPGEILFVGDDPERDYQGALKAGMNPVLIDRGKRYRKLNDVNRLSSLEQVPKLVKRRAGPKSS